MLNVFGIVEYILVVGYDDNGKDHDNTLSRVLQICKEANLKLNKDKCCFRCSPVPIFGEIIPGHGVKP